MERKCRVGHHVALERFHERDTRILAAAAAVGPPLIIGFRLQCDAEPLDATRIAGLIESNAGDADARIIASRHEPWKQIELAIRAADGSRIQDAFDLLWIARLRLHHQPQSLQLKSAHRLSPPMSRVLIAIQTSDDCFDHPFRLIGISDLDRNNPCFFGRIVVPSREQGIADKNHVLNGNAQDVSRVF